VVDNASVDDTVALVEAFAKAEPSVRVIRHARNLGYAQSNLTGFKHATGDLVVVTDSDGQHTLADLPLFLEKIRDGADIVYGWRRERHDPAFRKVISSGLSVASTLLLGWKLHDINCGFRMVTAEVARSLTKVHPVNYFGPELWVHARRNQFTVAEVIVHHSERKGGTGIHVPWKLPLTIARVFSYLFALQRELNGKADRRPEVSGSNPPA
jgi:glycosyltransferase involved in cell wall biosynthesis